MSDAFKIFYKKKGKIKKRNFLSKKVNHKLNNSIVLQLRITRFIYENFPYFPITTIQNEFCEKYRAYNKWKFKTGLRYLIRKKVIFYVRRSGLMWWYLNDKTFQKQRILDIEGFQHE
jgi:hypothetical protein